MTNVNEESIEESVTNLATKIKMAHTALDVLFQRSSKTCAQIYKVVVRIEPYRLTTN